MVLNEWLVTNGLGSYASGTVCGLTTRRYHGLFVVANSVSRTLLVNQVSEIIEFAGKKNTEPLYLGMNIWKDHSISPNGNSHLKEFYYDQTIPTWIYSGQSQGISQDVDFELKKTIFMPYGKNCVYVSYKVLRLSHSQKTTLKCQIFFNNRNFHALSQAKNIIRPDIQIKSNDFKIEEKNIPYYNYYLQEEEARGFDFIEDNIFGALCSVDIEEGKEYFFLIESTTNFSNEIIPASNVTSDIHQRNHELLMSSPVLLPWLRQLVLAADSFIVKRTSSNEDTILAGYHWFGDWGRDTFISLPGLCLATGRFEIAKSILYNYTKYISEGMVPNRFPDDNEIPDYNSMDSSLWFIEACTQYFKITKDYKFLEKIFPFIANIIDLHITGTRHNIHCDKNDGLLFGGFEGSQLTWMDAKCQEISFTPRVGKPIEINALWLNALKNICLFCGYLNKQGDCYEKILNIAEKNFSQFWCEEKGYCYDVLNSEQGHDISLRPNQIIALSLDYCPFSAEQKNKILNSCEEFLLTPFGLRSLAPHEKNYIGKYEGNSFARDKAYHQGTVWAWLLGRFSLAYFNVTKNREKALSFLKPMDGHIMEAGVGYVSEIFDGDFPHTPRGCIAQAWSVGELLWAAHIITPSVRD